MSEDKTFTVAEIAEICRGRLADPRRGEDIRVRRVESLEDAEADAVTWVTEEKHARMISRTRAAAIIGPVALLKTEPRGIITDDPEAAVADVLDAFLIPPERPQSGVHPTAVVAPTAKLGGGVAIGAGAVLHAGVRIGERTVIHEGVTLGRQVTVGEDCEVFDHCVVYDRCSIGDRVILHAGVVIGADGFGYLFRDGRHRKLAHIGTVVIEDDVEIGANSCVDRGKLGATRIGRGSKIDNLVMVAHNVRIGPLCVLAGQSGLSGSVRLGTGVALGGQAGVVHGVRVGDGVKAAAQSGIIGDLETGEVVFGMPARDRLKALRDAARVRKLGEFFEQVTDLKQRVAQLEAAAEHQNHG